MIKHAYIFFILFAVRASAQPGIEWQRCYGGSNVEEVREVQPTYDGGYILTGKTLSNNGDVSGNHGANDFWVVKLDSQGTIQWQKTYGGSNHDRSYSIQTTSDGGYIVAGSTESADGDVSDYHGGLDGWVVKINANGMLQWQTTLGGSNWDDVWDIQETSDGGYITAGRTSSDDGDVTGFHGAFDYWIVKLNNTGEIEWQKALGGSLYDIAYAISEAHEGGYIIAGESNSTDGDVGSLNGSSDYWVVKLTVTGEVEWEKSFGSSSLDRANDICRTTDNGYVVVGQISWGDGDVSEHRNGYDFWAVKITDEGEIVWETTIGGSKEDYCQSVQPTNDGGFILSGSTNSNDLDAHGNDGGRDFWLVKLNELGELLWQKTMGGLQGDWANCAFQTLDGGYMIGGYTQSNNTGDVSGFWGVQDYWVVKLSPETSSIPEIPASPLLLAPNPAQDYVRIRIPQQEGLLHITLSDATGRILQRRTIPNDSEFDLSGLPVGMYLFSATDKDGRVYAGKVARE